MSYNVRKTAARSMAALAAFMVVLVMPIESRATVKGAKTSPPKSGGAVGDNAVLADVNGEKVTAGRLREAMGSMDGRHRRVLVGEEKARHLLLQELISDRLVLQEMRKSGQASSSEFRDRMEAVKTIGLGNLYVQVKREEYVPSDNEVRPYLPRYWKTLSVRIFFAETLQDAERARESVLAGEDFEKIVKERSVGPNAERGGEIRNVRFGASIFPEHIDHMLFTQPVGWVSPVYEYDIAFCFVRIEKAEEFPAAMIEGIGREARERARAVAIQKMIDTEYERHRVEANTTLLDVLDGIPMSNWRERFEERVGTVDGKPVPVGDLYWYGMTGLSGAVSEPGRNRVADLFSSYVKYLGFSWKAGELRLQETEEVKKGIESYVEKTLLEMFSEDIRKAVRVTEKDAKAYFEKNRDALKRTEGREVRMITVREERTARQAADRISANPKDFERIAKELSVDPSAKKGGKIDAVYRGQLGEVFEKPLFGASEGAVVGPLNSDNFWFLFRVDRKIPAVDNPKYPEYAKQALEMARREKEAEVVRKRREELYRKAAVIIYSENLKTVAWPDDEKHIPEGKGKAH